MLNNSKTKRGQSANDPASTLSRNCRPRAITARTARSAQLQSPAIYHIYRKCIVHGPTYDVGVFRHEGQCRTRVGTEQTYPTAGQGSSGRGCTLYHDHQRVRLSIFFWSELTVRPTDMYIADLTEIVVKKKHLANPSSDWVLCLGDLSLALPLDRTVASLETNTDLALVKRQWAVEHGLGIGDRRGGDPSGKFHLQPVQISVLTDSIDIQATIGASRRTSVWFWPIGLQSDLHEVQRPSKDRYRSPRASTSPRWAVHTRMFSPQTR